MNKFYCYRRDPKRKSNTESPIAIVSIKPSEERVKSNFPQSSINSTLELYSAGFIVPWLVLNSISCENWWNIQNEVQIFKLLGKKSRAVARTVIRGVYIHLLADEFFLTSN